MQVISGSALYRNGARLPFRFHSLSLFRLDYPRYFHRSPRSILVNRFRVSPRIFHRSNREWRSRRKIILSSVKFLNFRIERQVKVEFFLSFSLSSSRFLFNYRVNYHRLIFLDEFLSEISVHDLLAKVSRSLQMSKTYKYTVFGGSKIQ